MMRRIKQLAQFIFSIKKKGCNKIVTIFGIKVKFRIEKIYIENQRSIETQDNYNLLELQNTRSIVAFLVPPEMDVNGGIMSIFSLCTNSRPVTKNFFCTLITFPGELTYSKNTLFENNEKVYRWSQLVENAKNIEKLILHIPEFYSHKFYGDLSKQDRLFLQATPKLQINILNQNILLMPPPAQIQSLYNITPTLTQTTAHERYATQEVCDKWNIPTHLLSVHLNTPTYASRAFTNKEKTIAVSPDHNPFKERILATLRESLPDFQIITIHGLSFNEYMDFVSKAFCTITFGEGMDGYFLQPPVVGSVSFAVYNSEFFPNENWKELENIYASYEEMEQCIVSDIIALLSDEIRYERIVSNVREKTREVYSEDNHNKRLENFYQENYDFLPSGRGSQ